MTDGIEIPIRWSLLDRFLLFRLNRGRDVKIVIVARSAATGTGKTTLAVHIAKRITSFLQCVECSYENEHGDIVGGFYPPECNKCPYCGSTKARPPVGFNADDHGYIDIIPYIQYYKYESNSGEVLILDEAEIGADNRRSMSKGNVELTQKWSALRYKNVVNIVTLPSTLHLDKRIEELGDVLITVQERGRAQVRWLWLNDKLKMVQTPRVRNEFGAPEDIYFDSLLGDKHYKEVSKMKSMHFEGENSESYYDSDSVEDIVKDETKEEKIEILQRLDERSNLSQKEMGKVVEMSQQWVSKQLSD